MKLTNAQKEELVWLATHKTETKEINPKTLKALKTKGLVETKWGDYETTANLTEQGWKVAEKL